MAGPGSATPTSHGSTTYGLDQIDAPEAWSTHDTQGEGTSVAVLDTGVDPDHPDIDLAGWAEFDGSGNEVNSEPYDCGSHGTHVSGTVAGGSASGEHIGVAPETTLYHAGVLTLNRDGDCGGTGSSVIAGMEWAVQQNADVISMSLGGGGYFTPDIDAVRNAEAAGTTVVAAIGNGGEGTSDSPGNVYDSISVGASTSNRGIRPSSSGEQIDTDSAWGAAAPGDWPGTYTVPSIAAPGAGVKSSLPGGQYGRYSGTSMATPHVSGAIALLESAVDRQLDPDEIERTLESTATKPADAPAPPGDRDTRYGSGIIDVPAAIGAVGGSLEANPLSLSTTYGESVSGTFDASSPTGGRLAYSVIDSPDNGEVEFAGDSFTYTPNPDFAGVDSFTYRASNGQVADTAVVSITVEGPNQPPQAANISLSTDKDAAVEGTFAGTDPDNDPLTYAVLTAPENGDVTVSGDSFTYTPDANFTGEDSFTYQANDGDLVDSATVSITVTDVNEPPQAADISLSTRADSPVSASFEATDPNDDPLTYLVLLDPNNGEVSVSEGSFTYTPDSGFTGEDSFTYQASDGRLADTATVSVTVEQPNEPPQAVDTSVSTRAGEPVSAAFEATDPNDDPLAYSVLLDPNNGDVTVSGNSFTYTPDSGFTGEDSFTYQVSDGQLADTATVSITVEQVNEPPQAVGLSLSTDEDEPVSAAFEASDPDGDSLAYSVLTGPNNGGVTISGNSFTYTPGAEFAGQDSFTYRVSDGRLSDTATVSITVEAVNDPPQAADIPLVTTVGSPISASFAATDPDNSWLTYSIASGPAGGAVSTTASSFTYTPDPGFTGPDSFVYEVSDGALSATGTVSVTVREGDTLAPPSVVGDRQPADPDGDGLFEAVRGDSDVTILDVQALFDNLDDPAVQNNAELYGFQAGGSSEVTILDVQGLFNELADT